MKLNFVIDKNYLIANTLFWAEGSVFSSQKYRKDIENFKNYAKKKNEKYYDLLVGRLEFFPDNLTTKNIKSFSEEISRKLPLYLGELSRSKEFNKVFSQTKKYLVICKKQWGINYKKTKEMIEELTGFSLNKNFTVFITHPSQKNGRYLDNNQITWGNYEKWPNYTTVYIWHEVIHSYFLNSDLVEGIIELIADNEIRCRLNGCKYPPLIGSKKYISLRNRLLPYWKKYLKSEKKYIKKFYRDMSKKFTITKKQRRSNEI